MPAKISQEDAVKSMKGADLLPLVDYEKSDVPWKCECLKCGEIVYPSLHSIRSGQGGCGFCAGTRVNPLKVIEYMKTQGFEPLEEYPGNKAKWKCRHIPCGSIVYPKYNSVQQGGPNSGCKDCSEKYVDPEEARSLMVAAGGVPLEPYPGATKKWKCKCLSCNQVVEALYSTVRGGGGVCRTCSLRKTAAGRRTPLAQVLEDFARVNLVPVESYSNTDSPLKSKCLVCGNFPSPTYTAIKSGIGCRYCSEKLIAPERAIELAMEAGLEPLEPFVNAQTPWKSRHQKCGEIVSPLFATISKGGTGCLRCNSASAAEKYRFPQEEAVAIMRNAQMEPLESYKNAVSRWKCKCLNCGGTIYPTMANVKNGSGCIRCTNIGFSLNEPAYFYLMVHPELNSFKVGVGGKSTRTDRISDHQKYGWILYNQASFETGESAYKLEQDILSWLRIELGLAKYLVAEQMPQGGHTETVDASEIDLPTIWAKVEEFGRFEE